jgi:hypothetical protein
VRIAHAMRRSERKLLAILASLSVLACGGDASEDAVDGSNTANECAPEAMGRAIAEALSSSACVTQEDCTFIGLPPACNGPVGRCPFPVARADREAIGALFGDLARQCCEPSSSEASAIEKLSCLTAVYCIEGRCESRIF